MIGIAPKPSRFNMPYDNSQFFTDLKNNKMIDHEIVSIYTRNELGNSSIIKFGSWDQSALKSGETLKMFRLGNLQDLTVRGMNTSYSGISFNQTWINFNPAVPYIHLSPDDWSKINAVSQNHIKNQLSSSYNYECNKNEGSCYFTEMTCDEVRALNLSGTDLAINMGYNFTYHVEWNDILVDGSYYQPKSDSEKRCYVGIFKTDTLPVGIWELGALAMKDYYIVYDMTLRPYTVSEHTFYARSIGIGLKNPEDIIRQVNYNSSYPGYRSNPLDVSYSIAPNDHPNHGKDNHKFVILVIILSSLFILVALVAIVKKCRSKSSVGQGMDESQVHHRDHL